MDAHSWPFPGRGIADRYVDSSGRAWRWNGTRPVLADGSEDELTNTPDVRPRTDNVYELGSPPMRYAQVRTATGVMSASDAREKANVRPLNAKELAAAVALSRALVMYQWKEAVDRKGTDGARWHVGMTVQGAAATISSAQLDPMRLAFICHDVYAGGDRYSFRDTQFAEFLLAGVSERVRTLEAAPRFARRLTTGADGKATVTLPAAGMVLSVTPRTAGVVIDSIAEATADNTTRATIAFRRLRSNAISLLGLVNLSLFESSPGAVTFDLVAAPATPLA